MGASGCVLTLLSAVTLGAAYRNGEPVLPQNEKLADCLYDDLIDTLKSNAPADPPKHFTCKLTVANC
jgi:hypothetical protein